MIEEDNAKELKKARKRMEKARAKKSLAETEFEKIDIKHKMRDKRKTRSGKEHLIQNLLAKKGMQMLESEVKFSRRTGGKPAQIRD